MKKKILSLQTIRAFAFLGIFLSHTRITSLPLGTWGVSVFLVLSGFLMTTAYYDKTLQTGFVPSLLFGWKKVLALYPLHILMMLAALPIFYKGIATTSVHIAANITLMQSWWPDSSVYFSLNSVAWYLSVCLFAYFVFPAVLKKLQRAASVKHLLIIAAVVIVLQNIPAYLTHHFRPIPIGDNFYKWVTYILPLSRVGDFIVGSVFGCIFVRRNREETLRPIAANVLELAALGLTLASILCSADKLNVWWSRYSLWYLPGALLLVYAFAINKGLLSKILTNKVTVWLGDLSAYGFLLHQMIIRYLQRLVPKVIGSHLSIPAYTVLAFLFTVAASVLYKKYLAARLAKPVNVAFSKISTKLLRNN